MREERELCKDGDAKKTSACPNCDEVGHFALECPKKKESDNASSSGGSAAALLDVRRRSVPLDHDAC